MKSGLARNLKLVSAFILMPTLSACSVAEVSDDPGSVFLGSPLLVIGILVGILAVIFAFYSWWQMSGGALGSVFLILGLALLAFDLGVIAVTFFEVTPTMKLIHDVALVLGFVLATVATNRMRSIFS